MCFSSPKAPDPPPVPPPPIPAAPLIPANSGDEPLEAGGKMGKKKLQVPLGAAKGSSGLGIPM